MPANEEDHDILKGVDDEIRPIVALLRGGGFKTIASCSGKQGHDFDYPMVRMEPCDPESLLTFLRGVGYGGFYVRDYWSSNKNRGREFTEVAFWTEACLEPSMVNK